MCLFAWGSFYRFFANTGNHPKSDLKKWVSIWKLSFRSLVRFELSDGFNKAPCVFWRTQKVRSFFQGFIVLKWHYYNRIGCFTCDDNGCVVFAYVFHRFCEILSCGGICNGLHLAPLPFNCTKYCTTCFGKCQYKNSNSTKAWRQTLDLRPKTCAAAYEGYFSAWHAISKNRWE